MAVFAFTVTLDNSKPVDLIDESNGLAELLERAFEAGCDDALFGVSNGQAFADFDREASSYDEAVKAVTGQLADLGFEVLTVTPIVDEESTVQVMNK